MSYSERFQFRYMLIIESFKFNLMDFEFSWISDFDNSLNMELIIVLNL